jgi:hypothetical protein
MSGDGQSADELVDILSKEFRSHEALLSSNKFVGKGHVVGYEFFSHVFGKAGIKGSLYFKFSRYITST